MLLCAAFLCPGEIREFPLDCFLGIAAVALMMTEYTTLLLWILFVVILTLLLVCLYKWLDR